MPSGDFVALSFFDRYYVEMNVRNSRGGKRTIGHDEFVSEVLAASVSRRHNNLFFLLGGVGLGKSTFLNYLITQYGSDLLAKHHIWFLSVDILHELTTARVTYSDMFDTLVEKLLRVTSRRSTLLNLLTPA